MSAACMIRRMGEAGASAEVIAIAVEEIERRRAAIISRLKASPQAVRLSSRGIVTRRSIPARLRLMVIDRDGGHCVYCGSKPDIIHLDHRLPISRGGEHTFSNLCVACPPCNGAKGAKLLDEWRP